MANEGGYAAALALWPPSPCGRPLPLASFPSLRASAPHQVEGAECPREQPEFENPSDVVVAETWVPSLSW